MRLLAAALFAALAAWMVAPAPASAQPLIDKCVAETCKARLTAPQLLDEVQALVSAKRYDEARPMLAALSNVPEMKLQTRFLTGFIASETGDYKRAEMLFRAILVDDPKQTRVRLELARALMAQGDTASAAHQYRLAADDPELPPEIARTIRTVRSILRSRRAWSADVAIGIAPDSNINNATSAQNVTVLFGDTAVPVTLDPSARATSGTGITGNASISARLPVAKNTSMLVDFDGTGTNYKGTAYDDYFAQTAIGPELRTSQTFSVSLQGVGARRWYGGHVVTDQIGLKAGVEKTLTEIQRVGFQVDARHTHAPFDSGYSGWQVGAYATYERVVARSFVVSASLFGRRDGLNQRAYSSTELGVNLGAGGELPAGFNIGLGGGVSRAVFDAPMQIFSPDPRRDWRWSARATVGNRAVRVLGFSPQVSWTLNKNDSSLDFFRTSRSKFRFTLARYF